MVPDLVYLLAIAPALVAGNPVQARQAETTISQADRHITGYAHPLTLYPLEASTSIQTALAYGSPPTPIPASGSAASILAVQKSADSKQQPNQAHAIATPTPTSSAAATCTTIAGSSPTSTIPAFCHPSLEVNAPSLRATATDGAELPVATKTISMVANKLECCAQCAALANCVAWKYEPVFMGEPSDTLPGGFDPWGRGDCKAVYFTGEAAATDRKLADSCPNGSPGNVLKGGSNNGERGGEDQWMNIYYNGWNQGQCGTPREVFKKGYTDDGFGDDDDMCPSA